jgi:Ca-activated chloride channel homolog
MWQLMEPRNLLLLLLPGIVSLFFIFKKRKPNLERQLSFPDNLTSLKQQSKKTKFIFRILFAFHWLVLSILIFLVCRPQKIISWVQKWTEGVDIVFVLDVSDSMDADDLKPSRILAAKSVIKDFVNHRPDDRIGLVIFGGEAILKSPLTRDFDFLLSQVDDVRLRELKQGTAIGNGLANGIARLRHSDSKNRILILLTDGDSNVGAINPITAAYLAKQEGIKVYCIGIGEQDRVLVPIYAYDSKGEKTQLIAKIPSYLNPELLKQISAITGGKAYMARDSGMLSRILHDIDELEKTKIKLLPMSKREDFFLIPALLASLLLFFLIFIEETRFQRRRLHGV